MLLEAVLALHMFSLLFWLLQDVEKRCLSDYSEGNLWVALAEGGAVACYDPQTGKQIRKASSPNPSCALCPSLTRAVHRSMFQDAA
jgi:hypothetical protein